MRFVHTSLLAWSLAALMSLAPALRAERRASKFPFAGRQVAMDTYSPGGKVGAVGATLVLLHGTSGPDLPIYRQQAEYFADRGFTVVVPHYFDATKSTAANSENYAAWARLVAALTASLTAGNESASNPVLLVGFSLGASVALAAGSQGLAVAAIAEWYGSLPDDFFYSFKSMPPLLILHGSRDNNVPVANAEQLIKLCNIKQLTCDSHLYPDQYHGFTGSALEDADSRTLEFFARTLRSGNSNPHN